MQSSWADSVANAEESAPATVIAPAPAANHQSGRPTLSTYVPPHLRGRSGSQVVHPLRTRQCLLQLLHQLRYGQLLCSLQATQLLLVAALVPLVGLALLAVVVAAP